MTYAFTASGDGMARVWRQAQSISEILWHATTCCIPIQKRMTLLGETEEEAADANTKARARVAELARAGAYKSSPTLHEPRLERR